MAEGPDAEKMTMYALISIISKTSGCIAGGLYFEDYYVQAASIYVRIYSNARSTQPSAGVPTPMPNE